MPVDVTEKTIRIRQRPPEDFQQESFRTITIDERKGIKAVIGRLIGKTTTTTQSYIFDKDKWTVADAKKWVLEHGGKILIQQNTEVRDCNNELLEFHHILLHAWFKKKEEGFDVPNDWSGGEIIQKHGEVVQELTRREVYFSHLPKTDRLDSTVNRLLAFDSVSDLPNQFKDLPTRAKNIVLKVINDTLEDGFSEVAAMKIAWVTVKKQYKLNPEGKWEIK